MVQTSQLAAVYLRRDRYIVISSSQTTAGFWTENDDCLTFDTAVTVDDLGAGVLRMLDASRTGVPTPDFRQTGPATSVQAAGLKSVSTFMKGAKYVALERRGVTIQVMPHRNGGTAEGFVGLPEEAVELRDATPQQLGQQVLSALQRAT